MKGKLSKYSGIGGAILAAIGIFVPFYTTGISFVQLIIENNPDIFILAPTLFMLGLIVGFCYYLFKVGGKSRPLVHSVFLWMTIVFADQEFGNGNTKSCGYWMIIGGAILMSIASLMSPKKPEQ